jgi:hypothetical protein
VRFVSFKQTFEFKKNRNEIKDKNDCQMMALLIDKNSFRYVYANLKQKIFYKKLIIKSRLKEAAFVFLRVTGTYESTRTLYRKLKGRS